MDEQFFNSKKGWSWTTKTGLLIVVSATILSLTLFLGQDVHTGDKESFTFQISDKEAASAVHLTGDALLDNTPTDLLNLVQGAEYTIGDTPSITMEAKVGVLYRKGGGTVVYYPNTSSVGKKVGFVPPRE